MGGVIFVIQVIHAQIKKYFIKVRFFVLSVKLSFFFEVFQKTEQTYYTHFRHYMWFLYDFYCEASFAFTINFYQIVFNSQNSIEKIIKLINC